MCDVVGSVGGRGLGFRLYVEIIETARQYAPMVAMVNLEQLFRLFDSVFIMTERDENTLVILLKTLTPQDQQKLLQVARHILQQEGNILADKIMELFGL